MTVIFSNLRCSCIALLSAVSLLAGVASADHIVGITATGSVGTEFPHQAVAHIVDGVGLDGSEPPQHLADDSDSYFQFWNDYDGAMDDAFAILDLNGTYDVGSLRFWNLNSVGAVSRVGRGLTQVNIAFSSTGSEPEDFGAAQSFFPSIAPGTNGYEGELFSLTTAAGAKFAMLTFGDGSTLEFEGTFNFDNGVVDNFAGFSEIQLYEAQEPSDGDFDGDGDTDGADFLLWQRNTTVGSLPDWEAGYGNTSALAATTAVPEPSSAVMVLLAATSLLTGRRRLHCIRSIIPSEKKKGSFTEKQAREP